VHEPVDVTLAALADPVRRGLVTRLAAGELDAGALAAGFEVSRPAVSRHLRVLREAGLVVVRTAGRHRVYALDRTALRALREWLDGVDGAGRRTSGGPATRLDALTTELYRGRRGRRVDPSPHEQEDGDEHQQHAHG
jgi:DNA-binding transcriptional ArsR family regulator